MNLEDLLEIIDSELEFILYYGDRIGIFSKNDKGLENYKKFPIWNINVEGDKLVVSLEY